MGLPSAHADVQTRNVQACIHEHAQAHKKLLSDPQKPSVTKCACRQCSRSHAIMSVHCDSAAGASARDFGLTRSGKVGPHTYPQHTRAHCVSWKGVLAAQFWDTPHTDAWQGLQAAVRRSACSAQRLVCNQSA